MNDAPKPGPLDEKVSARPRPVVGLFMTPSRSESNVSQVTRTPFGGSSINMICLDNIGEIAAGTHRERGVLAKKKKGHIHVRMALAASGNLSATFNPMSICMSTYPTS